MEVLGEIVILNVEVKSQAGPNWQYTKPLRYIRYIPEKEKALELTPCGHTRAGGQPVWPPGYRRKVLLFHILQPAHPPGGQVCGGTTVKNSRRVSFFFHRVCAAGRNTMA